MSSRWKAGTLVFMLALLAFLRPLDQPHYRIIVADGLGYYSYLPATFIYHDHDYQFQWFPEVYKKYYPSANEDPLNHFMVQYGSRKINLYYPGVALLQLPFFLTGHLVAYFTEQPMDGFSWPYQLFIALSAIFYAWLALLLLDKIIMAVTQSRQAALFAILCLLLGTNLFVYAIFNGCYSHVYSFFAITACYYAAQRFFTGKTSKSLFFTCAFALLVITIRPVNLLTLAGILFFYQPFSIKAVIQQIQPRTIWQPLLIMLLLLAWSIRITFLQTGSVVANTYTIGHFTWHRWDHVLMNLLGFQSGVLWYTPLLLLPFTGIGNSTKNWKMLWLYGTVIGMFLIYGFWWYFSIAPRTIVDISAVFGILLAVTFKESTRKRLMVVVATVGIALFQLKAYQLRKGILNANYTYADYYRQMFFELHSVNRFPVNPDYIVQISVVHENFEELSSADITNQQAYEGHKAAQLNEGIEFAASFKYKVPAFMQHKGFPKIKVAFRIKRAEKMTNIHVVYALSRGDSVYHYGVGYINTSVPPNNWIYNEFGMDAPHNLREGDYLNVYFWNPDHQSEAFIDDLTTAFILTNGKDEITGD